VESVQVACGSASPSNRALEENTERRNDQPTKKPKDVKNMFEELSGKKIICNQIPAVPYSDIVALCEGLPLSDLFSG